MINTLQNIIKELKKASNLQIVNESFSNEILLNQSVQSSMLGDITFFNVDFIGSHIVACNFKNCNLTRLAFYNGNFKNCNLINVNLTEQVMFLNLNSLKQNLRIVSWIL